MATRRTTAKIEVPIKSHDKNIDIGSPTGVDAPLMTGSPFLPTLLEASLLAIYPGALLFGSLFSSLQPASRDAVYSTVLQSYLPEQAPSYFAKKSNVFNVYFVKIGWFWTTLAFFLLVFTHPSLGPTLQPQITKRRLQAMLRYVCVTTVWIFVTQWFFGPPIIDRSFRWTGGQCELVFSDTPSDRAARVDMNDFREVFTHAACKAIGGQWKGGHDISGHVFLLILGSAMLWLELLPAVLRTEGLREARRVRIPDGLVQSASVEADDGTGDRVGISRTLGIGVKVALAVAGLSWWMLLMTAAYFHTWFEKLTGLLVAFTALYAIYFLPRAIPGLRQVLGLPGV